MKTLLTSALSLVLMLSNNGWSQGHPDASGEASIKIERSSEHKAEGAEFQKKVPVTLEYHDDACAASLNLEYYQKGAEAHVKSTLINEVCAASSGTYTLRILYLPDEGEMGELEFEESWSRDDDADVVTEKDYLVGDDLEIRRVSSRKLKCECVIADTEEEGS